MMAILAMVFYVGCYTDAEHPQGLRAIEVDPVSGEMSLKASYPVDYPIYLAKSADGKYLYTTVTRGLAAFSLDNGKVTEIGRCDCGGTPCHLAIMPDGERVAWADYSSGTAGSVALQGGKFFGEVTVHRHCGCGPNLPRQDKAHCHQVVPTPDGKGYVVVDLGLDRLVTYPQERAFATYPRGAGPRHMIFHPNGKLAFVAFELGNLIASFEWDAKRGFVRMLDQCQTLESWPSGRPYNGDLVAAIRFTPDGRNLVVSNRGEESLVVYDYDENTGSLSFRARTRLPGSWPRDFLFLDDTLAVVTMERSGEVHSLRYDAQTGKFAKLSTIGGFFRPVAAVR